MSPLKSAPLSASLAATFVLVLPLDGPAAPARGLASILDHARRAAGPDRRAGDGVTLRGDVEYLGRSGHFEQRFGPDGRFMRRVDAPVTDRLGFDGATSWAVDWSGMPRVLEGRERLWNRILMAVQSGGWIGDSLIEKRPIEDAPSGTVALALRHGPMECRLEIDPESWLPARLIRRQIIGEEVWNFRDYLEFRGRRVPGVAVQTLLGITNTFTTRSIEPLAARDEGFELPEERPDDTRFLPGVAPEIAVRRAPTGHFLVNPRVNGEDVGWFILDTGAGSSTIAPEVARRLGLTQIGTTGLLSVMGAEVAPMWRGATLALGPIEKAQPIFVEMDFEPMTHALGETPAGVIGYDLISRAILEVDVAGDRVAIRDPAAYDGSARPWTELHLMDRHPVVEASFEGDRRGLFKLDIGASGGPFGNVILNAPTVRDLDLLDGRQVHRVTVGTGEMAVGRLEWFEVGGHRFESPRAVFAEGGPGPFQDPYTSGVIGVNFLTPFRLVLDYGGRRAAFVARGD